MLNEKTDVDLGLDTVAFLRARYQVEDEWIEIRERGFQWWPAELEQEVWAEPAWDDEGRAGRPSRSSGRSGPAGNHRPAPRP